MEKVFISTIPLQGGTDLQKLLYQPEGFTLKNNRETCFPVIPVIAENMDEDTTVKVIAVTLENDDVRRNYGKFVQELAELGISEDKVIRIPINEEIRRETQIDLMKKILKNVADDSMIYADITYGIKPTSVIMTFMMIYLPILKPNCSIQGLYYGQFPRRNKEGLTDRARLCDLTDFVYMGEIVQQLDNMDISNPERFFLKLIERE